MKFRFIYQIKELGLAMPEPFKNIFNADLIRRMAEVFDVKSLPYDKSIFLQSAIEGLADLEMMARSEQISTAFEKSLTVEYLDVLPSLISSLHPSKTSELSAMTTDGNGIAGWAIVPLASYIARVGGGYPEESLCALRLLTMRFSAEFAVRFFLRDSTEISLKAISEWAEDPNFHVRRLASEGIRTRLPWGIRLHKFIENPEPVVAILEKLKDDPSEYVRKSVANNLNDLSKDHPELVCDIARRWMINASIERSKLVKHACRTLLKSGHPEVLSVFGFAKPKLSNVSLKCPENIQLGQVMSIAFGCQSLADQNLMIDYVLYFMRANGTLSPKVFKWTSVQSGAGDTIALTKQHSYKKVTTRKDYPGIQFVAIQINGVEVARSEFELSL